jgi:hypothetical protein
MAVVWTLNVSDAAILGGQRMSVSAMVGRRLGASRGVPRQIRTSGAGLADDFKAVSLQAHFWVGNAPYAVNDLVNPLISQRMRPPSERTTDVQLRPRRNCLKSQSKPVKLDLLAHA